jgi:hypothetical protein
MIEKCGVTPACRKCSLIDPDGAGSAATLVYHMDARWAEYVPQTGKGLRNMLEQIDSYSGWHIGFPRFVAHPNGPGR